MNMVGNIGMWLLAAAAHGATLDVKLDGKTGTFPPTTSSSR